MCCLVPHRFVLNPSATRSIIMKMGMFSLSRQRMPLETWKLRWVIWVCTIATNLPSLCGFQDSYISSIWEENYLLPHCCTAFHYCPLFDDKSSSFSKLLPPLPSLPPYNVASRGHFEHTDSTLYGGGRGKRGNSEIVKKGQVSHDFFVVARTQLHVEHRCFYSRYAFSK